MLGLDPVPLVCLALLMPVVLMAETPVVPLAGTEPLTRSGDLSTGMVEAIHTWLDHQTRRSIADRDRHWLRDFTSKAAYGRSIEGNRVRFRKIIGAVDERVSFASLTTTAVWPPALRKESLPPGGVRAELVRWPVFPGVEAEGILLIPNSAPVARIVALPDADWTPEYISGLQDAPLQHQFARRLAESGCLVLVPTLIDRRETWSGNRGVRFTNQPHREYIYRMAFEMGRHIIGYEVEKVLAAVDFFSRQSVAAPIGVVGYGEGGLIAFYAAASDTRIDAALVSGYFRPREGLWLEPIYRDVWRLLEEFGDANIASLIAPRGLVIEMSHHPELTGPPLERPDRKGAAPGRIGSPLPAAVTAEFERAQAIFEKLGAGKRIQLVKSGDGLDEPGTEAALSAFLQILGVSTTLVEPSTNIPSMRTLIAERSERMQRQVQQLVDHTQTLVRRSDLDRRKFWSRGQKDAAWYRAYFEDEIMGKLPKPNAPLKAETARIYDTPSFTGYNVVIPVLDEVYAYGILLVPKGMQPGERRPVVVTQHGLEDRPSDLIEPPNQRARDVYQRYAAALAERGFIVYAPQNPYLGQDRFRSIVRKAHPLQLSLYSLIAAQHRRTLDWLTTLDFVDPARIGFYGLSYGGKTAMRIPAVEPRYAAVICSGDFNEWIWKITSVDEPFSYMYTQEYDMLEFDLGPTFNYAELAALIAPRPFMVERGHRDPVGIDEWIAYEFASVRRLYDSLGLGDRTELEFFDGPHQIHGVGTFEFLHRHLNWPRPTTATQ